MDAKKEKFYRECGVSEFRLLAHGLLALEVYTADPKAFDALIDRHFKEMHKELSGMERKRPEPKKKKSDGLESV